MKLSRGQKRKYQGRRTVKPEDSQLGPKMDLILRTSMWPGLNVNCDFPNRSYLLRVRYSFVVVYV